MIIISRERNQQMFLHVANFQWHTKETLVSLYQLTYVKCKDFNRKAVQSCIEMQALYLPCTQLTASKIRTAMHCQVYRASQYHKVYSTNSQISVPNSQKVIKFKNPNYYACKSLLIYYFHDKKQRPNSQKVQKRNMVTICGVDPTILCTPILLVVQLTRFQAC